jgi:hypothetical protein
VAIADEPPQLVTKDDGVMDAAQVQAARIVIGKILPDMRAVEHTGKDGGPLVVNVNKCA